MTTKKFIEKHTDPFYLMGFGVFLWAISAVGINILFIHSVVFIVLGIVGICVALLGFVMLHNYQKTHKIM